MGPSVTRGPWDSVSRVGVDRIQYTWYDCYATVLPLQMLLLQYYYQ